MMNSAYHRMNKQSGFSIMDALIAAVVVGVGLLGAAKFQTELFRQSASIKDRSVALNSANSLIDRIRANNNPTTYALLGSGQDINNNFTSNSSGKIGRNWVVTDALAPIYKAIDIVTSWTSADKTPNASLATFIAPHDPLMKGSSQYFAGKDYPSTTPLTEYSAIITGTVTQLSGHADWGISVTASPLLGTCVTAANTFTCGVSGIPIANPMQDITVVFTPDDVPCTTSPVVVSVTPTSPSLQLSFTHAATSAGCV